MFNTSPAFTISFPIAIEPLRTVVLENPSAVFKIENKVPLTAATPTGVFT